MKHHLLRTLLLAFLLAVSITASSLAVNADLSYLSVGTGSLNPTFASATTAYTARGFVGATTMTVTPWVVVSTSTVQIRVNGGSYAAVTSGSASAPLTLSVGDNTVDVKVTASDGITKIYTVTVSPTIAVEDPFGTPLTNGSGTTDFGQVAMGAYSAASFTIRNVGQRNLTPGAITFDGANSGDFSVTIYPAAAVAPAGVYPAGSTTFTIRFSPGATGSRTAICHIASNDTAHTPFNIALTGTGTAASVGALQVTLSPASVVAAGVKWQVDGGIWRDSGAVIPNLAVGSHTVTFGDTGGFVTPPAQTVAITGNQTTPALGTYIAPILAVEQPAGTSLTSGSSIAAFGSVPTGTNASKTFTIKNNGTANLTSVALSFEGASSGDFSVTASPTTSVALGGGSAIFTVRFAPSTTGPRSATLHITSNDPGTNPFNIALAGTGTVGSGTGSLQVTIAPSTAAADGAKWQVDGGGWQGSGALVALAAGSHVVSFNSPAGYIPTPSKSVTVAAGQTTTFAATCYPPGGPLDNWSARIAQPQDIALRGIAFGNNTFVAVGGGVLTSPDGINWTPQSTGIRTALNGVLFAQGLFVAVGDSGVILTSPDGMQWTRQNTASGGNDIMGICYANGRFIVGGGNGPLLTSANGVSWTVLAAGNGDYVQGVAFGNGQYVAVGFGSILTSTDGINWLRRVADDGEGGPLYGVAFGSGTFLINGHNGYLTSPDGFIWTTSTTSPPFTADLTPGAGSATTAFGNGIYVTVIGIGGISTSPDRVVWTDRSVTYPAISYGFAYGNGVYVAVGGNGFIQSSTDAVTWLSRTSGTTIRLFGATFGNGKFVVVGDTGTVLTSTDGVSWAAHNVAAQYRFFSVSYLNGLFVAAGDHTVLTSPDGISWTDRTPIPGVIYEGAAYGNGKYVLTNFGGVVYTSTDTISWTALTPSGISGWSDHGIAFGNGTFVVVAYGGRIATSTDGVTWTPRTSSTTNDLYAVTFANNIFVALGGGTLLTSPDGVTWTPRSYSTSTLAPLPSILGGAGYFVDLWGIGYGNGVFFSETDGVIVTDFAGIAATSNSPVINLEQPVGMGLTNGLGTVDFGQLLTGATQSLTFTIRNSGFVNLTLGALTIDGVNPSDFGVIAAPASPIPPWGSTTFTVSFTPGGTGSRNAVMHIPSNDPATSSFAINLTGTGAGTTLAATYTTGLEAPLNVAGFTATGKTVNLTINYAPVPGTQLMVVKNTSLGFINGTFSNLAQGQYVPLTYDGVTYNFAANYYGGTGNDLVLQWANTMPMAWGWNNFGELGNGSRTSSAVPAAVSTSGVLAGKTILAMAGGNSKSLALCSDGTLAEWGDVPGSETHVPVDVTTAGVLAGKRVIAVSAADGHNLALCSDGTVATWGYNTSGQLGNNSTVASNLPVAVNAAPGVSALAGKTVVAVSAGSYHNLALCSDGTVAAWGSNTSGQLGNNTTINSPVPVSVNIAGVLSGKTIIAVSAGSNNSLALCSDGIVVAWGDNNCGELGNNTYTSSFVPVAVYTMGVLAGKTVIAVSAGDLYNLALCSDGTVVAWGNPGNGDFGDGNTYSTCISVPVAATTAGISALAGKTVIAVAAGRGHSLGFCSDGTVTAWGYNGGGELGNNTETDSLFPVAVNTASLPAGARFIVAASGPSSDHSLGIVDTVNAAPIFYLLNVTATHGAVARNPSQTTYAAGAQVVLTATPAAGYLFTGWSGDASGTADPLTVTMNNNKNITANFTPIQYTVTPLPSANGSISPNTVQTVNRGGSVSFTATPAAGYVVDQWLRNGSSAQNGGTGYTVGNVTANSTVQATFRLATAQTYTVTPSAPGGNGQISPSTVQTVGSGSSVSFTATPAAGYVVNQWLVNGSLAQTGGNGFTAGNITANITVQVNFKTQSYTVTPIPPVNGSVNPGTPQTVISGGSLGFVATPAAGYVVNQWLRDGNSAQNGGNSYTVGNVTANSTVQGTFRLATAQTYTVTPSAPGGNGQISPGTVQTVGGGSDMFFTATPDSGYVVDQWLRNGSLAQAGGNSFTVGNVTANTTVQVTFKLNPFTSWQSSHFTATQLGNISLSGWNGDANGSGIPNGLKFLFDLNATGAMTAADSSALPHAGVEFSGGLQYLTLTYRQNPQASALNVQVQIAPDLTLNSWPPVTPDFIQSLAPDPITGDPRNKVMVNVTGQTKAFIRLQVTGF